MGCTLDEVAAELGVTREGARQIEARALAKLRRAFARQRMSFEDLLGVEPARGEADLPRRQQR